MIGKTVGNYRIVARIGAGGMGEVFLAEDTRLDRKAAIKFLPAEMANSPERRQRFLIEAKAASALNHPHVCTVYDTVYDVGETVDGLPFIAMEFVEGDSLQQLLSRGSLEIVRIVDIVIQVADALDAAHSARIVHRDIKPGNINLNERGKVKVLDFGLAKRLPHVAGGQDDATHDLRQTHDGEVLGTPSYMSPEQALGKDLDHRTDLFSLGVVLYEMTTGQLPFRGASFVETVSNIIQAQPSAIARFNYDVPPELERITLKCLQKAPDRRYQSARELMLDLKQLARELEFGGSGAAASFNPALSRVGGAALAAESMSLEALKTSDVLLNYAAIDDQPLLEGKPGWVSQLHRNLEVRVEQLSGEKVSIARLPDMSGSSIISAEVLEHLPRVKAMISVVSPPFIKSGACRSEVEQFWRIAAQTGGQWVEERARLLKVLKTSRSRAAFVSSMRPSDRPSSSDSSSACMTWRTTSARF
jgi:serine/threonine protein kinase